MRTTTITLSGNTTTELGAGTRVTSTHYSERHAQVYYAQRRLELAGWTVTLPRSGEGYRLPLKYPDEPMGWPLDAGRHRAHGFSATFGATWLWLDASGDLPVVVHYEEPASEETQTALAVLREAGFTW